MTAGGIVSGYDGQLGTVIFKLHRNETTGAPEMHVVQEAREPGRTIIGAAGRMDSIIIESLHHGPGQEVAASDPMRYADTDGVWTLEQGRIMPGGAIDTLSVGPGSPIAGFSYFIDTTGDSYLIGDQVLQRIQTDGTQTTLVTLTGDKHFTGSVTRYMSLFWLGIDTAAGVATSALTLQQPATVTERTGIPTSLFFAHRDKLWRIKNNDTTGQVDVLFSDAALPIAEADYVSIGRAESGGRAVSLWVLGQRMIAFKEGGGILGFDENRRFVSIYESELPFIDKMYGRYAKQWGGKVIIPHSTGAQALSLEDLTVRDITPTASQGVSPSTGIYGYVRLIPKVVQPMGDAAYIGTRSASAFLGEIGGVALQSHLLVLKSYPDGAFYNMLGPSPSSGDINAICSHYSTISGTSFLYTLQTPPSGLAGVKRVSLPQADRPPLKITTSAGPLRTSFYGVMGDAGNVTKQFLQVRGYAASMGTDSSTDTWTIKAQVDTGSDITLGTVTANGPFSLPFPQTTAALGRVVRLKISWATTNGAARTQWPSLVCPLFIDFMYEPSPFDLITLNVDTSTVEGRTGSNVENVETTYTNFRNLVRTVQTLRLYDSETSWTVFVERVERTKIMGKTGLRGDREAIQVQVRRF